MKKHILTLIAITLSTVCFGQTDTIYSNNETFSCVVKEITPDVVKYTFQGEELINSIYKNTVQKIVFKSGRVQTFAETKIYKKIMGVDDFENVIVTQFESEVKGLHKIGDLYSNKSGATIFSSQGKIKERAMQSLKMQGAMQGANAIYLTNIQMTGNSNGFNYYYGMSKETHLTAVGFSSQMPNIDEFKKVINDKKSFTAVLEAKMWSDSDKIVKTDIQRNFLINNISLDNGMIIVDGEFKFEPKCKSFRVVSFDKDCFFVYYKYKNTAYNIKIKI
ncbi:MAG: hypothetical protein KA313_10165 [Pseudarcicella sp.]|nr:hypothetical protein [Pseudarcicella sp.]MBP6411453.1 hypothetical protein [Pseudarcicella sp.]